MKLLRNLELTLIKIIFIFEKLLILVLYLFLKMLLRKKLFKYFKIIKDLALVLQEKEKKYLKNMIE